MTHETILKGRIRRLRHALMTIRDEFDDLPGHIAAKNMRSIASSSITLDELTREEIERIACKVLESEKQEGAE